MSMNVDDLSGFVIECRSSLIMGATKPFAHVGDLLKTLHLNFLSLLFLGTETVPRYGG